MKEIAQPRLFALRKEEQEASVERPSGIGDRIRRVFGGTQGEGSSEQKEIRVANIRPVQPKDYIHILRWFTDPDSQAHLSPLPELPKDWNDEEQVIESIHYLGQYYTNEGEPEKITALAAVNEKDKPLGVTTIRWRGDPWVPKGHKIASIERLLVNPRIRGKGVGSKLVERALEIAFKDKDYPEVRTWVMSDELARGWGRIIELFARFGFDQILDQDRSWKKYQEKRGMVPDNRDAKFLSLKREEREKRKRESVSKMASSQETSEK